MIDKPLYQNPLGGGLTAEMQMSNAGMKIDPFGVRLEPQADMPKILGEPLRPKSDDPLVQGYMNSDFYESRTTANVVPFTYKGKEMTGSGSYASNFKKYLESIGKGDLIQFPDQGIAQQGSGPLATIGGPTAPPGSGMPMNPFMGQIDTPEQLIESGQFAPGVGQDVTGNNPMEIAVPSIPDSFNRVGEQLTGPGFNQSNDILETLQNIEKGIASLGQGNMNQSSFGGFNNNFGIGSFFPPYGGMYG